MKTETIRLQCASLKILAKNRLRSGDKTVHDDIMAAVKTIESLAADALRYRFLRSEESRNNQHYTRRCLDVGLNDWAKNFNRKARANFWSKHEIAGDEMDKSIDAAMKLFTKAEGKGR